MVGDKFVILRKLLKAIGLPDERIEEFISSIQSWLEDDEDEKKDKVRYPYHLKDEYLTAAELSFYHVLTRAVGDWSVVIAQVSLDNLFYPQTGDYGQNRRYRNRIDRKRLDFLLCDPKTLRPLLGIELDDKSHKRKDRRRRDQFVDGVFAAAGLPLVHIRTNYNYDAQKLRHFLQQKANVPSNGAPVEEAPVEEEVTVGEQPATPECPECKQPMVLRTAKSGRNAGNRFWGCANFPQCREIMAYKLP